MTDNPHSLEERNWSPEEVAFVQREYCELISAITMAVLPIYQVHASSDRYAQGAFDAQDRISKAIHPMLVASVKRFGKLGGRLTDAHRQLDKLDRLSDPALKSAIHHINYALNMKGGVCGEDRTDNAIRLVVDTLTALRSPA